VSNQDIAQKQLDAYNAQDLDTYVSYFAADCVVSGLNGTPTENSRDALHARYAKAFAQFPQNKADQPRRFRKVGSCRFAALPRPKFSLPASLSRLRMRNGPRP
jgi:hypothetical protein